MELHQMLHDFRMESFERIESMENSLLHLNHVPGCRVAINNLFRAIRTLKESAGLFGLEGFVVLADAMESVLVRLGEHEASSNEPLVILLLSCCDHMRTLIEQTSSEWHGSPLLEVETAENELLGQLKGYRLKFSAEWGGHI